MDEHSNSSHAPNAEDDEINGHNSALDSHHHTHDESETQDESLEETHAPQSGQGKNAIPMQKRRRVTRACDECRRKKIKCDGKQPCTHCTVYSYECTYDQPSNRRRNPTPQHIEGLILRLQKAEDILRVLAPDLSLDDPRLLNTDAKQIVASLRRNEPRETPAPAPAAAVATSFSTPPPANNTQQQDTSVEGADSSFLETMMENCGSLDLDDQGHWDYHGHSSSIIFMQRLRKQIGNVFAMPVRPSTKAVPMLHMLESPKSQSESPQELNGHSHTPPTHDLPAKDVGKRLCQSAFGHACILMRFVHEPTFWATFDRVYATSWEQFTNEEHTFLPLLYVVMAVGCLFSTDVESTIDRSGYEGAIGQGFQYFRACRQLLDITDCRDLTSLQAICFMILFLQATAKLSTCYSYVGIALRSALRLGLHRKVSANFNPVESELRRRIFWVVRKMDIYVSSLLGLPQMVSDEDIDQEYPLNIDDEFITPTGILAMPSDRTSLMAGANAHTDLADIIVKVVKYIYPVKLAKHKSKSDHTYMVSHSKIREIERDLQAWMENLPPMLRPGSEVSPEVERMQQLLRISYGHVQMMMYRPFLHYVSNSFQNQGIDKRSYACAAACISVARNVVHITASMYRKGLLNGSYWFVMYTTYFAILSLVFFVLENPDLSTAKDGILKDALEGKTTLAMLAKKSMAADRCAQSLTGLFKQLPEKLKNRHTSAANHHNLKRPSPSNTATKSRMQRPSSMSLPFETPQRSNSFPAKLVAPQERHVNELNNNNKTVDDAVPPRRTQTWLWDGISDSTESPTSMSPAFSHQGSPAATQSLNPQSTQQPFISAQQLGASQILPDLMPIMFPSGDQLAYPAQPLSTLEDGHFKDELPTSPMQYTQESITSTQTSTPVLNGSFTQNTPSNVFDGFSGIQGLSTRANATSAAATTLAPHLQRLGLQTTQIHSSPATQASSTPDTIQSPDLVSLPHNYMWQSFSLFNQNNNNNNNNNNLYDPSSMKGQVVPGGDKMNTTAMVTDDTGGLEGMPPSMGMNMGFDMDVNFGEILGNNYGTNPNNMSSNMNDDWSQWMNNGV